METTGAMRPEVRTARRGTARFPGGAAQGEFTGDGLIPH
jgi:hypothetical protein